MYACQSISVSVRTAAGQLFKVEQRPELQAQQYVQGTFQIISAVRKMSKATSAGPMNLDSGCRPFATSSTRLYACLYNGEGAEVAMIGRKLQVSFHERKWPTRNALGKLKLGLTMWRLQKARVQPH
jgi:hypothetical protein